jgi:carboxyl-terminal processing protease
MKKRIYLSAFPILILIQSYYLNIALCAGEGNISHSSRIDGKVLDAQNKPVYGSVVILCDKKAGSPICKDTFHLLIDSFVKREKNSTSLLYAVTNPLGEFSFENIPAGEYRLIAQKWKDADSIKGILEKNGQTIELNGIDDNIQAKAGNTSNVIINPVGTGVLRFNQNIPNDDTLLAISSKPTCADPVLGFAGWGGPFIQNMLCGNMMPGGKTTVTGLPEGTIYFAMFANDDVPGWLAGQVEIKSNTSTILDNIPFVNSWSNSRYEPPDELLPVFNEVKQITSDNVNFILNIYNEIGMKADSRLFGMMSAVAPHLEKELVLPSGLKTTIGDVIASVYYLQLQQAVQKREEKTKRNKNVGDVKAATGTAGKGTYKESFIDLYDVLGKQYPCFELKGIDWKAVGQEFLPRVEKVTNDNEFGLLCLELVARLEDSHSNLQAGTTKLPEISNPQWDPGFACIEDDKGRPIIYYIDKNGPAEKAGIKIGMVVKSVNGRNSDDVIADTMKFYKKYIGYSSERYLRYHAIQFFLRQAEQNSIVKLELLGLDGNIKNYELPAVFKVRYLPRLPVPIDGIADSGEVSWKMLDGDIGYIYVRRIDDNLVTLLDKATGELKKAKGIIIDVRGNSGGGFDSNKAFLNFALDKDSGEPQRPQFKVPMVLLIDSRCISAGEGWASWFAANKRAKIFGSATAGASSRKTTYELKNGLYKVHFSVKAYTGFLDRPIERIGLVPDVPVTQNANDIAKGIDTVLETAKKYLIKEVKV